MVAVRPTAVAPATVRVARRPVSTGGEASHRDRVGASSDGIARVTVVISAPTTGSTGGFGRCSTTGSDRRGAHGER